MSLGINTKSEEFNDECGLHLLSYYNSCSVTIVLFVYKYSCVCVFRDSTEQMSAKFSQVATVPTSASNRTSRQSDSEASSTTHSGQTDACFLFFIIQHYLILYSDWPKGVNRLFSTAR